MIGDEGPTGDGYAIPTKDENLKTRPLAEISGSIEKFHAFASVEDSTLLLLTPIGTGLAGHTQKTITEELRKFYWPNNVAFTSSWINE